MLRELHVKNLALIDDLRIRFEPGFSIFTGETGAGKSILIGAIGLLLGERASSEMVRSGFDEADISGVFELAGASRAFEKLCADAAIPLDEGAIIVRRTISRAGRNRIYVNQVPLPLATLKQIGDALIDFHGQHEHQSLLNPDAHREIIDALPRVAGPRAEYDAGYRAYAAARAELDEFNLRARELAEKRDMLEFQYQEIHALGLRPGEEEQAENELALLSSSADRARLAAEIAAILSNEQASPGIQLGAVKKRIESLAKFDASVTAWLRDLDGALATVSELERFCASYADAASDGADPARIEALNGRIARIQRCRKKYRCTPDELIAKEEQLAADLRCVQNIEGDRSLLEKKERAAYEACSAAGLRLSESRAKAAADFDRRVSSQMERLGLAGGVWKTRFAAFDAPAPEGLEAVEFFVQTNPGEPPLPLVKTASGGEISRLMLAIKAVVAGHDRVPILIFDEIDTGIGGMVANEVAQALYALRASHQVVCISHLHQIASIADHHYHVYKEETGGRTVTRVKKLEDGEKVDEIARMLGGDSEIAKKHARELLGRKG